MFPNDWEKLFRIKKIKTIGKERLVKAICHQASHGLIELLYKMIPVTISIIPDRNKKNDGSTILV